MAITEVRTGSIKEVIVDKIEDGDYRALTRKRYFFPWKEWKGRADVYKLRVVGGKEILGVMALENIPGDQRIEIKLLASSIENVGPDKVYEGIAGCLIAYAGREAVKKYAEMACISLVPKTELKVHYIKAYGMIDAGRQLFLEGKLLTDLISKYLI